MTLGDRTPTPSLRRRVVLTTIAVLAVLLAILGVTIDLAVGAQARRDLHDRLMSTAARADALTAAGATPAGVVAELGGGGIRVRLIRGDGTSYGDGSLPADPPDGDVKPPPPPPPPASAAPPPDHGAPPPPPPPARPPAPPDGTATAIRHRLIDGSTLVLVANTTAITTVLSQLRTVVVVSSIAVLLVAAAGLTIVVHVAMAPLRRLTAVAGSITSGDRGRRLRPDRPHTELGSAATALDAMLDALEDSESRAHRAAQDAERANASTRRFLADAAHELRTPIAGIHAGAERIAAEAIQRPDDPVDVAQRHRAELVLTEARRAGRLVADMLDLGRIDAGETLDLRDCDLVAIVEDERVRSALLAPAVEMTRTGERTLAVRADPLRVGQIVTNLADNARRHTPAGGSITFDVGTRDGMATVTVTDTGDGVPDGERARIFERLVRLDDARARDHGGAGLGLPIARALARAHGGDVTCPSHQPGARFVLVLPLVRVDALRSQPSHAASLGDARGRGA